MHVEYYRVWFHLTERGHEYDLSCAQADIIQLVRWRH